MIKLHSVGYPMIILWGAIQIVTENWDWFVYVWLFFLVVLKKKISLQSSSTWFLALVIQSKKVFLKKNQRALCCLRLKLMIRAECSILGLLQINNLFWRKGNSVFPSYWKYFSSSSFLKESSGLMRWTVQSAVSLLAPWSERASEFFKWQEKELQALSWIVLPWRQGNIRGVFILTGSEL